MAGGFVMTPGEIPVTLAAPGLRARTPERDDNGNELRIYELDAIAPGSALRLTLQGIPTHASVGKWVALALVLALVAAGIVGARRSRQTLKLSPEQKAG
jgi:hypothetical protein